MNCRLVARLRSSVPAAALLLGSVPAFAQSAPADQIVVTGSRLPAGVRAPTPLTVLGAQAIEDRSPATIGEILQQIPSFGEIDSPNTAGVTSRGGAQINPDLRARLRCVTSLSITWIV